MALTKPKLSQNIDTDISVFTDPILVLRQGATSANADVGFLFNRANGLVSNVAFHWSESANSFVTAFTTSSGAPDANVTPTSFANIRVGTATANIFQSNDYRYSNGAAFVSTTLANTAEITANKSSGQNVGLSLTTTGVTAGNYGSATSIPTIVVDSKGRITSLTANAVSTTINLAGTSGTGSVAGGGTLTVAGTTNQITTAVSSSTITIALATDITAPGNLTVTGNLTVQGNTTTFNTETLTVEDKLITIANGAATAGDADGSGLNVAGANANLIYVNVTDTWNTTKGLIVPGANITTANISTLTVTGITRVIGDLVANSGTTSSSTTTGALVVDGGIGVSNDIRAGGAIVPGTDNTGFVGNATNTWANGQFTNLTVDSTLSVRAAIDLADNDVLRFGSSDDWEFFHNGTGNYIDLNVGDLIIRDNTTQRASFARTTGNLVLDSTTTSTSTTTGALVVKGGAGITGTLYTGVLNINGVYQFPTSDGVSGQALITNGSGILTFANVTGGGGGATGFPQSTVTIFPSGDYGSGEEGGVNTGSATIDVFEVPLGALYDAHEPRGSIVTVDLET